jgi:hypothetical protein
MPRYVADLAPKQLLEEAYKLLVKDQARLGGTNYPAYKGKTISPMSSLTQRSRELTDQFAQKGAPYSKKIESVLQRGNQDISRENIEALLGTLRRDQQGFNYNKTLGTLKKQFGSSYKPREYEFARKSEKDLTRGLNEASGKLQDLSRTSGILEGNRNQQIAKTLQLLQQEKQGRREGLTGALEMFVKQKQAYNNIVNKANKDAFEDETQNPQKRMQMLQEMLEPIQRGLDQGIPPELEKVKGQQIAQALKAYGIDTSKPIEEWENTRLPQPTYPGDRVAPLTPGMKASYSLLERLSPSLKDELSEDRKNIIQGLMGHENIGTKALQNVPVATRGQIEQLEKQARQTIKKDLGALNNQYIKLGQYGSPQHMTMAEKRARDVNKSVLEQRNKLIEDALKNQLTTEHGAEINNIKRLNQIGSQQHKQFGDILLDARTLNKRGSTEWENEQAKNEELYKNFQNERLWEWPHLRNQIRGNAQNEFIKGLGERNIDLDRLSQLNTSYSEMEKELEKRNQDILNNRQYYDSRLATLEEELASARKEREEQARRNAEYQEKMRVEAEQRQQAVEQEKQRLANIAPNMRPQPGRVDRNLHHLRLSANTLLHQNLLPEWTPPSLGQANERQILLQKIKEAYKQSPKDYSFPQDPRAFEEHWKNKFEDPKYNTTYSQTMDDYWKNNFPQYTLGYKRFFNN